MFWKYVLYHAALWMAPPATCVPPCDAPLPPPTPVCAPCPVPVANTYAVGVRFTTGQPVHLKAAVCEGEPMTTVRGKWKCDQGDKEWALGVRIDKVRGHLADLECALTVVDANGHRSTHRAHTTVPLDSLSTVYLKTPGPEPCCADVTVSRLVEMPAPMPVAYTQAPVPVSLPMPHPLPISYPAETLTQVPYVRAPEPVRGTSPLVPCDVIQPVRATAITRVITKSHVKLVRDGDTSHLHLKCEAGTMTYVRRMTLDKGAAGPITLAAGKERVHLSGQQWKAQADEVEINDDGQIYLRGNVRLHSERLGTAAVIAAEDLVVEVKHGKFEKIVTK